MWTDFPLCYIGGSATSTLTIVALVGSVGRGGIAAATGCTSEHFSTEETNGQYRTPLE